MSEPTTEWGVRIGTWPTRAYQSRATALFYATHPYAGDEEFTHTAMTRNVIYGEWEEIGADE